MSDQTPRVPETNAWGQPIGPSLADFQLPKAPEACRLAGSWCRLEALSAEHTSSLWQAYRQASDATWTYLPYGPFLDETEFGEWLSTQLGSRDPLFFSVIDRKTGQPQGVLSLMRVTPSFATIEVGHVHFSPRLQRTPAATEAFSLVAEYVFDELGYRRLEWKCDALNSPSRSAALRLGFRFEGIFRKHMIYKQRSRDTAWYALLDDEWEARRREFQRWLEPSNFDAQGAQRTRLVRSEVSQ
jgi:RimJ/RimL family protein N-acetyltransferase